MTQAKKKGKKFDLKYFSEFFRIIINIEKMPCGRHLFMLSERHRLLKRFFVNGFIGTSVIVGSGLLIKGIIDRKQPTKINIERDVFEFESMN